MEETGWLSCPGGARKVRGPNPGSAAWLTTPSGARTPSRSPWIRTSRAHSSTFHAIEARARRAPALQPFPAERAAIRNRPRGKKSCITLLCQESHLTTSMDAQGSKAQRPCEFLKIFGNVPTFTVFPVCFGPWRLGGTKELFRFYRLNCRGPVTSRWEPF